MDDKIQRAMEMGFSGTKPSDAYQAMAGDDIQKTVAEIEKPGNVAVLGMWLIPRISFQVAKDLLTKTEEAIPVVKQWTEPLSDHAFTYFAMSIWETLLRHNDMWFKK